MWQNSRMQSVGSSLGAQYMVMAREDVIKGIVSAPTVEDTAAIFLGMAPQYTYMWPELANAAIAQGANSTRVDLALKQAQEQLLRKPLRPGVVLWGLLGTASFVASVYHGYKRNESVGWAIWWGAMGALFPIVTPTIAIAQGFGKPKRARAAFGRYEHEISVHTATPDDLIRLARLRGYEIVRGRGKGSHVVMAKPGHPTITVPGGKRMSPNVARRMLKVLRNAA